MSWSERADRVLRSQIRHFGEPVTFTPQGGAAASVSGIFDATTEAIDLDTGMPVRRARPQLGVRLADLPSAPEEGDQVQVRGIDYVVVDVDEDGQGGAKLLLQRA